MPVFRVRRVPLLSSAEWLRGSPRISEDRNLSGLQNFSHIGAGQLVLRRYTS